jgi:hypothetical protein
MVYGRLIFSRYYSMSMTLLLLLTTFAVHSACGPLHVNDDAAKPQLSGYNPLSNQSPAAIVQQSSGGGVITRQRRRVITLPTSSQTAQVAKCRMNPLKPEQHRRLVAMVKSANTIVNTPAPSRSTLVHLVTYNVSFPEYDVNPLPGHTDTFFLDDDNSTAIYKPCCWTRVLSDHGRLLVAGGLPFNRNALSLTLLSFGVENLGNVALVDVPPGCMGGQTMDDDARLSAVIDLLTRDLDAENPWSQGPSFRQDVDFVCHQIITRDAHNNNGSNNSGNKRDEFEDNSDEGVDDKTNNKVATFSYRSVYTSDTMLHG